MVNRRELLAPYLALALALLGPACSCRPELEATDPGQVELRSQDSIFPWTAVFSGVESRLTATPGGTWQIDFELEVDLRSRSPFVVGRFEKLLVVLFGERRYDAEGRFRSGASNYALSSNFTTTGVPIQSFDHWPSLRLIHGKNGSPFEGVTTFDLTGRGDPRRHRLKGRLSVKVPTDIPRGHYQPHVALMVQVAGTRQPLFLEMFSMTWKRRPFPALPLVAVGRPAAAKIPLSLFAGAYTPGRRGTLPQESEGKVGLNIRTGFPSRLILPPGFSPLRPGLPSLFPRGNLPSLVGGDDSFPERLDSYLRLDRGEVTYEVKGPGGPGVSGKRKLVGVDDAGLRLAGGPVQADMQRPGEYTVRLKARLQDRYGRSLIGGGTYRVHVARPLTFSTSCKPGNNFLVGDAYPGKVNVNPPVPASVELTVRYFPRSDPGRLRVWRARGKANRFGHFVPRGAPLVFDEPGEYFSRVRASYRGRRGMLWMGQQTSSGVIAPLRPRITLHGARSFPHGLRPARPRNGAKERFVEQPTFGDLALFSGPVQPIAPANPYHQADTLYLTSTGFNDIDLETRFSVAVPQPGLARLLRQANTHPLVVTPPPHQRPGKPYRLIKGALLRSKGAALIWQPATPASHDELPVSSVARGKLHPMVFPERNRLDAYLYTSSIRPGFPAMTSVLQKDGLGLYWCTNPNQFGNHINSGFNGDLVGDVYRVMAGVVLKDRDSGQTYYDAYSSVVSTVAGPRPAAAVLAPGKRPLVSESGRDHHLFLATDTHDVLEVGERIGLGGMIFPNVPARVTWTITSPSGRRTVLRARADRLGVVRGGTVKVDRPGLYAIVAKVEHGGKTGGIVGTRGGAYWHCAVPKKPPALLSTSLPPVSRLGPGQPVRIPLRWSGDLAGVKIHYGVMMPGQVVVQGTARVAGGTGWVYTFDPMEVAIRIPYLDVRDFGMGGLALADTVVFQFLLEGRTGDGRTVHDAARVVLRGETLMSLVASPAR